MAANWVRGEFPAGSLGELAVWGVLLQLFII